MSATPDDLRDMARKRLQERRAFGSHLVTYLVVNAMLIGIWATTGAGYFWPGWILGGWGIGLVLHAWQSFGQRPITGAEIDREVERLRAGDVVAPAEAPERDKVAR